MDEDEEEGEADCGGDGGGVGDSPGDASEEHEEGEEVGEGGVGAVPGVFRFWEGVRGWVLVRGGKRLEGAHVSGCRGCLAEITFGGGKAAYMIVDRSEDFLWRDQEARHLPYCHLEIHLGEFE